MTHKPRLEIVSTNVFVKRLGFRMDVAHGLASRFYSDNVYVEFVSRSGIAGYGECVPRPYVTGETPETAVAALKALLPALTAGELDSPRAVIARLNDASLTETGVKNPAALCAAELALLDLAGKRWNLSAAEIIGLGTSAERLIYSLVAPLFPPVAMEKFLAHASGFQFGYAKIKVNGQDPAGHVRRVKSLLPPNTELRVDVNCSWGLDDARKHIKELVKEGVVSVEQPLPAKELDDMARLRGAGTLITLDESISRPEDVERAADAGACDVVNVRVSKCGGLLGALRVISAAKRRGLGVQLGAQVGESCILSAAGALLAAGTPDFKWREGSFGAHLLQEDLCADNFGFGMYGRLTPPSGPGLGVIIDRGRLSDN